jgi:serine/threonine protein kinase
VLALALDLTLMADNPSKVAPGSVLVGRYRVLNLLGEGAMGEVFVVEHLMTQHHRALKRLRPEVLVLHPTLAKRFLNEASAAGKIGNPHIVETVDAGALEDGAPFLVMELLQGQGLDARLQERTRLEVAEAAELIAQAATGIHAAHEKGIVHRDLKPANLFIVGGAVPFVKILDFGVSRFGADQAPEFRMTQPGEIMGTPYYLAPEQARGDGNIDRRVDVYALGVVLYECLTGRLPYEAQSYYELFTKIVSGMAVPLLEHRPDLPECIVDVVARAMAPEPNARYKTAAELEAALRCLPLPGIHRSDPYLGMLPSLHPGPRMPPASEVAGAQTRPSASSSNRPEAHDATKVSASEVAVVQARSSASIADPPARYDATRQSAAVSKPPAGLLTTHGPVTQSRPTARGRNALAAKPKHLFWIGAGLLLFGLGGATTAWLTRTTHAIPAVGTNAAQTLAAPPLPTLSVIASSHTNPQTDPALIAGSPDPTAAIPAAAPRRRTQEKPVAVSSGSAPRTSAGAVTVAAATATPATPLAVAPEASHAPAPAAVKTLADKAGLQQKNPFAR